MIICTGKLIPLGRRELQDLGVFFLYDHATKILAKNKKFCDRNCLIIGQSIWVFFFTLEAALYPLARRLDRYKYLINEIYIFYFLLGIVIS